MQPRRTWDNMQKARSKLLGAAATTCAQVPIVRISSLFIYFFFSDILESKSEMFTLVRWLPG